MKYTELSDEAKKVAIQDYIKGWKETHPDEELSLKEANGLCVDSNDDVEYYEDGTLVIEGWTHEMMTPDSDGGTQCFGYWKRDKTEIEILRFYDDDNEKYDDDYAIFEQIEYQKGSWDGNELAVCDTLQEAIDTAITIVKSYEEED